MSQPPARYAVSNVLEILDECDSDFSGLTIDSCSDEEFTIPRNHEGTDDEADKSDEAVSAESEWDSQGEVPLRNFKGLAPSINYKWCNRTFTPPSDTEFCGDTKLPDLQTYRNGEVTPYSFLKMFLTDEMISTAVNTTNRYSVEKHGYSVNTASQEFKQAIGMFYFVGLVQMSNTRSYWENEICYQPVAGVMPRDRFLKLLTVLHFVDNNTITEEEKKDKLWKLRPWFDALRQNFMLIPPEECQSVDEIIIPVKGRSGLKVYTPKKPHRWGFKLWVRSDSDDYIYDSDLYQPILDYEVSELGKSAGVVEKMTESLPDGKHHKVFADNYFSSIALAEKLKK